MFLSLKSLNNKDEYCESEFPTMKQGMKRAVGYDRQIQMEEHCSNVHQLKLFMFFKQLHANSPLAWRSVTPVMISRVREFLIWNVRDLTFSGSKIL